MQSIFPSSYPSLPFFKTLLIQGPCHPSAPLHLCLSHAAISPTNNVLLIAPSRAKLQQELKEFNEDWLGEHGRHGFMARSATRVQMLYPPTTTHLAMVLSALHGSDTGGKESYVPKTTFATPPSLVILCDLSAYVTGNPESTVSSYLLLVTQALTAVAALSANSGSPTSLAIFDSGLVDLRLPLVRPSAPIFFVKIEEGREPPPQRTESVAFLASRFFEWVGVIYAVHGEGFNEEAPQNVPPEDTVRTCKLQLKRPQGDGEEVALHWRERKKKSREGDGYRTVFTFEWS